MLADVRSIISEQLGTDIDKVRCPSDSFSRHQHVSDRPAHTPACARPILQVAPAAKFVDLGADSLDTVRHCTAPRMRMSADCILCCAPLCVPCLCCC